MAFTAATPLLAMRTFSMTFPLDPPSSETYDATSWKRRWRLGLEAAILDFMEGGILPSSECVQRSEQVQKEKRTPHAIGRYI
ncbi:hypothetical protein ACHAXS_013475 [Conticribra weissflogii]